MRSIVLTGSLANGVGLAIFSGIIPVLTASTGHAADAPRTEEDGTIHVPAFDFPESSFLSDESRAELRRNRDPEKNAFLVIRNACPALEDAARADVPAIRKCQAESFYKTPFYKKVRERYAVKVTNEEIGGVYSEIFTPAEGVAPANAGRVLINVHGGGFVGGARTNSHLESIPIASVGKIKVISIDYRMAPEYSFPAASEDVEAVYRQVLKSYKPENIGLYGCSAGGILTAQSMAWFQNKKLPLPGAIGMFCAGAWPSGGDSKPLGAAIAAGSRPTNTPAPAKQPSYFKDEDLKDPLAFPGVAAEMMAHFPPSLLIASTRDFLLSSVVVTHAQLVKLGVEADLHVWEGLSHAFFFYPELSESREAYDVIVKFFSRHLGK